MCDYSLEQVASRPARVGDKLVSTRFPTGTGGFATIDEPNVTSAEVFAFQEELKCEGPFFGRGDRQLPSQGGPISEIDRSSLMSIMTRWSCRMVI